MPHINPTSIDYVGEIWFDSEWSAGSPSDLMDSYHVRYIINGVEMTGKWSEKADSRVKSAEKRAEKFRENLISLGNLSKV